MLAIERTTRQFVASVKEALPDARIQIDRSRTRHGRSNYVYIGLEPGYFNLLKVRISDHAIGMQRARYGNEDLHLDHRATPDRWAVWVSELPARRRAIVRATPAAEGACP